MAAVARPIFGVTPVDDPICEPAGGWTKATLQIALDILWERQDKEVITGIAMTLLSYWEQAEDSIDDVADAIGLAHARVR